MRTLVTTVLICDDHRRFREHLRRYVAAVPGVDRVMTAETSAETFVRYAAELPALVLLDVAMPDLGGPETARLLVSAHPGANVVMLAGTADSENLARAMAFVKEFASPSATKSFCPDYPCRCRNAKARKADNRQQASLG